jgi:hypothetical protein
MRRILRPRRPFALALTEPRIAALEGWILGIVDTPSPDMNPESPPDFEPLTGLYEPSAIQQLPDGRFLVVEDEKARPFSLVTIRPDGQVSTTPLLAPEGADDAVWKLDDLEALALDREGWLYTLTSHSRTGSGEVKKGRDKLVRFRVEGDRMAAPGLVRDLRPALVAAHPVLAAAAEVPDVKEAGGLNIEALEVAPDGGQLLVGFRSPLLEGRALVARVENPVAMFEADAPPRIARTLITLDLDGSGLRGMAWVAALAGYLLISGPVARQQVPFRLWFWGGRADDAARRVRVGDRQGFEHAEGVTPALLGGRPHVVLVSDDGDREAGRCARYLLLDPARLVIEA